MYKELNSTNEIQRLSDNATIPKDRGNRDYLEYLQWVEAGNSPIQLEKPPPVELFALATQQTQKRLDTFAQERGYDGILSLCTYASDPLPEYAKEGQLGVVLRSKTWEALRDVQKEILAGKRPMPEKWEDVEDLLPKLSWT